MSSIEELMDKKKDLWNLLVCGITLVAWILLSVVPKLSIVISVGLAFISGNALGKVWMRAYPKKDKSLSEDLKKVI